MEILHSSIRLWRVKLEDLDPPEVITLCGHYHTAMIVRRALSKES